MLQLPIDPEAVEAQQRTEREAAARQQREAHHADHAALRDLREHFRLVMDRAFRQHSAGQLWRPQLLGAEVQVGCCFGLRRVMDMTMVGLLQPSSCMPACCCGLSCWGLNAAGVLGLLQRRCGSADGSGGISAAAQLLGAAVQVGRCCWLREGGSCTVLRELMPS